MIREKCIFISFSISARTLPILAGRTETGLGKKKPWGGRWSCFDVKGNFLCSFYLLFVYMHGPTQENRRCVGPLCGCCCLPSKKLYLIMVCVGTPVSFRDYISGLPPEKVTVGNRRLPQISVLFAAKPGGYIMCKRVRSARIKSVSFPWKAWLSLWHWLCHPKKLTVTRLFKAGCWGMFLVF